jgi:hypothetical protein
MNRLTCWFLICNGGGIERGVRLYVAQLCWRQRLRRRLGVSTPHHAGLYAVLKPHREGSHPLE